MSEQRASGAVQLWRLFHPELALRAEAMRALRRSCDGGEALQSATCYALRDVLLGDERAAQRIAASKLLALAITRRSASRRRGDNAQGAPSDAQVGAWLAQALDDAASSVREAACAALARMTPAAAQLLLARLDRVCLADRSWSVRRAAVRARVALVSSAQLESALSAVSVLRAVLDDPFWRVRFAALQGLSLLVQAHEQRGGDDSLRSAALAERPGAGEAADAALRYLSLSLDAAPLSQLDHAETQARRAPLRHDLPAALHPLLADADPAVVTAQLQSLDVGALEARELVGLLADSHRALRRVAVRRLEQLILEGDDARAKEALIAALGWLDEPRVPHAAETVRALLSRLDHRADELAGEVLAGGARTRVGAGAVAWACDHAARRRLDALRDPLRELVAGADAATRDEPWASATRALGALLVADGERAGEQLAPLLAALTCRQVAVRAAAVDALAELGGEAALDVLAQCRLDAAARDGQPWPTQADEVLVDAWRRRELKAPIAAALAEGPLSRHSAAVGAALLAAARALGLQEPKLEARVVEALASPDPWLRAAALDGARAAELLEAGAVVRDPLLHRAAVRVLARSLEHDGERTRWAARLAGDADPYVRGRAARLLRLDRPAASPGGDDEALIVALRLSRDEEPMVRHWAASALEQTEQLDARLDALLAGDGSEVDHVCTGALRAAAYAQRLRGPDDIERLRQALAQEHDDEARAQLEVIALAIDDAAADAALQAAARASAATPTAATPRDGAADRSAREVAQPIIAPRPLWRGGPQVTPLCVSGANGPAEGSLRVAVESGVELFFWEPTYRTLTPFVARRPELRVIAGSYNADPRGVARDLDRARRRLGRDRIDVFLLFWARSAARVDRAAYEMMARLRDSGRVGAIGFSSHHRDIAAEAIARDPWDLVMVRHSAAHPGAEQTLLPVALERGVSVLTFSALCYGRMLRRVPGAEPAAAQAQAQAQAHARGERPAAPLAAVEPLPSAAQCYRYTLEQPGVSAVISAPRRHSELLHNLAVLDDEPLSAELRAQLLAHGQKVRAHSRAFNRFVRRGDVWGTPREIALRWLEQQEQEDAR